MTIPTLSTSDKSFICSYTIGANVDFRLASGVMNEIETYTTEYIEGKCWIPVFAPTETNDESNFCDVMEKDIVYVKVGCRVSSDGYIHTWLLSTQAISELVLWNNRYNTINQPEDDTTTLHWSIEKLYKQVIGNITGFVSGNIKFQNYIGATYLQLFGNNTFTLINTMSYTPSNLIGCGVTWYPTNSSITLTDILYALGSVAASRTWSASSTWIKYEKGNSITNTGRIFEVIVAGITGTTEPLWNTNVGTNTTDGTITWRCCSTHWNGKYCHTKMGSDGWTIPQYPQETPWGRSPDATSPQFWLWDNILSSKSVSVNSHCQPGTAGTVNHNQCNCGGITVTGNQSGRIYDCGLYTSSLGCYPGTFPYIPDDGSNIPNNKGFYIDERGNEAYIWVPSACSGASGGSQTECEANGGTWIPGHYACDPSFVYDSSVTVTYYGYTEVTPDQIDYINGKAHFNGIDVNRPIESLYRYGDESVIDTFNEISGDLDELRSISLSTTIGNRGVILCTQTPLVGIGLMSNNIGLITSTDWTVTWGANDYFNSWQSPDGLSARNPGSTQTLIIRPLTHHDAFYTTGIDIEGGFLYEPTTSNAFLSRTINNETKIHIPLYYNTEFNWLYNSNISNGFLSRSIDIQGKLHTPITNETEFKWLYTSIISDVFLSRMIDNEDKIETPLCYETEFCWMYKFEEPWVSKHRFLKIGGNDTFDGKTFATAWEHWSYAMTTITEGGRLYTADGTYSESVEMSPQKALELFLIDAAGDDAPAEVKVVPS